MKEIVLDEGVVVLRTIDGCDNVKVEVRKGVDFNPLISDYNNSVELTYRKLSDIYNSLEEIDYCKGCKEECVYGTLCYLKPSDFKELSIEVLKDKISRGVVTLNVLKGATTEDNSYYLTVGLSELRNTVSVSFVNLSLLGSLHIDYATKEVIEDNRNSYDQLSIYKQGVSYWRGYQCMLHSIYKMLYADSNCVIEPIEGVLEAPEQ